MKLIVNVFPNLFGSIVASPIKIKDMSDWNDDDLVWNLTKSFVTLNVQAHEKLTKLEQILVMVHPKQMGADSFV